MISIAKDGLQVANPLEARFSQKERFTLLLINAIIKLNIDETLRYLSQETYVSNTPRPYETVLCKITQIAEV